VKLGEPGMPVKLSPPGRLSKKGAVGAVTVKVTITVSDVFPELNTT
jgi:hypothetical protein